MSVDPADVMAVVMARLLRDGETVFYGVNSPLPMVAVALARRGLGRAITEINIAGGLNPKPTRLPRSTVAHELTMGSTTVIDNPEFYDLVARGGIDVAFLGAGQIDARGRVNTSAIGDYHRPKVRLPGGGGAAMIFRTARRVIVWRAAHTPRIFVEEVPFVTASGNLDRVVTPLCVFCATADGLEVESVHPGVTAEQLQAATGFTIRFRGGQLRQTPPPTDEERAALAEIDPEGIRRLEFH